MQAFRIPGLERPRSHPPSLDIYPYMLHIAIMRDEGHGVEGQDHGVRNRVQPYVSIRTQCCPPFRFES